MVEDIKNRPDFLAKMYLKRALTFKRIEIFERNLLHTWFFLLLIIRCAPFSFFSFFFCFKFCKRLCASAAELSPTLVIEILVSFKSNIYVKIARILEKNAFWSASCSNVKWLCKTRLLKCYNSLWIFKIRRLNETEIPE